MNVIFNGFTNTFCALYPNFIWSEPLSWLRLFSYTFGHANIGHLIGNLSFILLLGPVLESKYGTRRILLMSLLTSVITAVFFLMFFNNALLGASGIVFMFIMLTSMSSARSGEIPLSFLLVLFLFLGKEIINSFENDRIAQSAHLIGGLSGSLFGYWLQVKSSHKK